MIVWVGTDELKSKLFAVSKAVAKKSINPALSAFKFSVSDTMEVHATDLETGAKAKIEVLERDGDGEFAVEANTLFEIVKNLPGDTVTFDLNGDTLVLNSEKSRFRLATMDVSKFPDFVTVDTDSPVEIDTSTLEDMINKVIFSAATDEFMRNLNGVFWEFTGDTLRLVASDGFRLALSETELNAPLELSFLVPLKGMKEIQNVVSNTTEPNIYVAYDGKRVSVKAGDVEVVVRVVDANFPDYRRVIPFEDRFAVKVSTSRSELLDALKRANVIVKKGGDVVKFEVASGKFVLSGVSQDVGEVVEEIEADVEGGELVAGFNPRFLIEALKAIDTNEVQLMFVNNTTPLKIQPADKEDYFYIIMPVRLT